MFVQKSVKKSSKKRKVVINKKDEKMSIVNQVQLIGRFGKKPESIKNEGKEMIVRGSLCTNEHYKDQHGNKVQQDNWHNIVAFGNVAARIEKYVEKGVLIKIEGRLRTRNYKDNQGIERYTTEVIVEDVLFLQSKKEQ